MDRGMFLGTLVGCLLAARLADALDVSDLPSVSIGTKCVAKGLTLERVVRMFDEDSRWEFRCDAKRIGPDGISGALIDKGRTENPFMLFFAFSGAQPIGQAQLVRIAWTGKPEEVTPSFSKTIGCRP